MRWQVEMGRLRLVPLEELLVLVRALCSLDLNRFHVVSFGLIAPLFVLVRHDLVNRLNTVVNEQ